MVYYYKCRFPLAMFLSGCSLVILFFTEYFDVASSQFNMSKCLCNNVKNVYIGYNNS